MDLPNERMFTPEEIAIIDEAIADLDRYVRQKRQKIMEDKVNWMAAGGGMTPELEAAFQKERAKEIQELEKMETRLKGLTQMMEDTILVLNARLFERAKLVHQAMREASKTDPSLEAAVRELDALYAEAQRQQDPLKADDDTSEQAEG
ncbi:MAG: hypothetical protein ACK4TA_07785 [Saprospiraceae bacterium]